MTGAFTMFPLSIGPGPSGMLMEILLVPLPMLLENDELRAVGSPIGKTLAKGADSVDVPAGLLSVTPSSTLRRMTESTPVVGNVTLEDV